MTASLTQGRFSPRRQCVGNAPRVGSLAVGLLLLFVMAMLGPLDCAFAAAETGDVEPERLAILVGNGSYPNVYDTPNAPNDARDIGGKLSEMGFAVVVATDVSKEGFLELLDGMKERLDAAESVVFYYAGHGFQFEGENYLVPTSARLENEADITGQTVKLADVISRLQDRQRPTLIFLDACRDNPLGSGREAGLAQLDGGDSTFIAFATQPGAVTADGDARNSPFAQALLAHLDRPGLSVSDLMIKVRTTVEALTLGRQTPWDQSSLRQQFYFAEAPEIDPSVLEANFMAILGRPELQDELRVRLASSDPNALHSFIMSYSDDGASTTRSLDTGLPVGSAAGEADPKAALGGNKPVQLATLSPTAAAGGTAKPEVAVQNGLATLLSPGGGNNGGLGEKELARRVQTELARLGCYRMGIDGLWGRGSQKAMNDYNKERGKSFVVEAPSMDALTGLFLDSGRVCKAPVVKKAPATASLTTKGSSRATSSSSSRKKVTKPTKSRTKTAARTPSKKKAATSSRRSSPKKAAPRRAAASKPRAPAQLPPDISGGIGIGGIF